MRLDQDLIRLILLDVEDAELVDLAAYTEEQIQYHKAQLVKSGLLEGEVKQVALSGLTLVYVTDLSWEGHQFLANARNDTVWNRAKSEIVKLGGSLSIEAIKLLLSRIASETAT